MLSAIFYIVVVVVCYLYNYPNPEEKFSVIMTIGIVFIIYQLSQCSKRLLMIYEEMPEYDDDGDDDGTKKTPLTEEPLEDSIGVI